MHNILEMDAVWIIRAAAESGHRIPLNAVREIDTDGVCKVIRALGKERAVFQAEALISEARVERLKWQVECLEKDVARLKRRIEEFQRVEKGEGR